MKTGVSRRRRPKKVRITKKHRLEFIRAVCNQIIQWEEMGIPQYGFKVLIDNTGKLTSV